jgi:hypothetical protein
VAADAWEPRHEAAWSAAYELIAAVMLEGAAAAALADAA